MFVFCIRAPFWKNGCYGAEYGHLSDVRPISLRKKSKNRNAIRRWAVRRFQPRSLPCCTLQQGDKRHPVCCFHRWQAVRWYCEAVKTKHFYSYCELLLFCFSENLIVADTLYIFCASNRLAFAPPCDNKFWFMCEKLKVSTVMADTFDVLFACLVYLSLRAM